MVSRRSTGVVPVLGLVLLVALAGCAGVFGGGGGDGGGTPDDDGATATPPNLSNESLPPGVNRTQLVDVDALLSAHRETMAESGFAYTFEQRQFEEVVENGSKTTNIASAGEVRASPGLAAFRRTVDRDVPVNETTGTWTDGTEGYERVVADDTSYERRYENATERAADHYVLEQFLSNGVWRLTDATDDRIVLTANSSVDGITVEGRIEVDSRGRIRSLNATMTDREYVDQVGRIRNHRTLVYDVTAVGDVEVSPPDWVDEARNATGGMDPLLAIAP